MFALTAALSPAAALATPPTPSSVLVCLPDTPVCQEVRGAPGDFRLWFKINNAPAPVGLSFTVNGSPASGSVSTHDAGEAVEGEFRPVTPLVSGDVACLSYAGGSGEHCATAP
ncbi:hypothetical protein E1267_04880 [Nonomuraea longispora]|uniref:Uncharacterized protein n=1 Tax=Nonomuraea longispora TaxID=1848320 RepID=A0A4R4NLR8_9ACTN|nr:hypothetical protein [Nonomuraea longispora]TDC10361.1 hypothetical protein E1267_04880 [Nonomuraea longispora]